MSMANNIVQSIETLPVEILHRIFDNLDAQTILSSIRPVCRLLRSVVNTYNRYILNFNIISKANIYLFCRLINPENIISLTFSDDYRTSDQIALFISLAHLQKFTRLRSLTLLSVNEDQLDFILTRIKLNTIISCLFTIKNYDDSLKETTASLLSSIVASSTLRRLEFGIESERISKIVWPTNCTIQYLTINHAITIDYFLAIVQCSPYLHTVVMSEIPTGIINNLTSTCLEQLTSLTINDLCTSIDELESFLLLTPSLVYLKLIGWKKVQDGKRWEELLRRNLPHLNKLVKFEFSFSECRSTKQTPTDLELMIASFQTPFWIEDKKWFVMSEYEKEYSKIIYLRSLPICKSSLFYTSTSEKVSLSTYPMMMNNDPTMMNNIKSLMLTLNQSLADDIQEKEATTNHPLFPKVTVADLQFRENWPLLSLQCLSMFIDISQIVTMKICSRYFNKYNQDTWMDIGNFIEQAHNLSSLLFECCFLTGTSSQTVENIIRLVLPRHVKHLQIPIDDVNRINIILERCKNLSTIKFIIEDPELSRKVVSWFLKNTINTTCQENDGWIAVWLGYRRLRSSNQ